MDTKKPKTSAAVKNRYRDKTYDRAEIFLPKGRKDELKRYAKQRKVSFNGLINTAIDYYISDDEYCQQLYENYLANTDPDKDETITIEDFAKELGVKL